MKMSGKAGLVEDYLDSYLEYNITAKAKFLELIENVVKARLAFDEKTLEGDDTITLNLEIPRTLHKMLKTASMDYTKANGRPMGLYAFCVAALKRIASERLFGAASTTPHDQPSNSELFDARSPSKPALKRFG
jgi:hypothetical protein